MTDDNTFLTQPVDHTVVKKKSSMISSVAELSPEEERIVNAAVTKMSNTMTQRIKENAKINESRIKMLLERFDETDKKQIEITKLMNKIKNENDSLTKRLNQYIEDNDEAVQKVTDTTQFDLFARMTDAPLNFSYLPVRPAELDHFIDLMKDSDAQFAKTTNLLQSMPNGDIVRKFCQPKFEETQETWQLTHEKNLANLLQYYRSVEPTKHLFDKKSVYDEWNVKDGKFFGMRHEETGEAHGIARFIDRNGVVVEATFRSGKQHGLSISLFEGQVVVNRYCHDTAESGFVFDRHFNETLRKLKVRQGLMSTKEWQDKMIRLTPAHFDPAIENAQSWPANDD